MFYFFPSNQMSLISFSWCIALAEIGSIGLIEEEGTDIFVSFLIAGKPLLQSVKRILGFLQMLFIRLKQILLMFYENSSYCEHFLAF